MNEYQLADLRTDMDSCEQTQGLSVLAHGYSVNAYYCDLYDHIVNMEPLKYEWRLPEWIHDPRLWSDNPCSSHIHKYQVYHDCGKPYCLTVDEDGKRHFPDHANVSADTWEKMGGHPLEVEFMRRDMDIHMLKAAGVPRFMEFEHWPVLLLTGLAELHSNAPMFGGIESTSFKIKWKNIDKRGKNMIKLLEKQQ